jgi:hypothetical protein
VSEPQHYGEDDLRRRLAAREACARLSRRARCVRCKAAIPAGKRADAKYCSAACKARHRWEQRDLLKREIRLTLRAMKTKERCDCGTPLDVRVRVGPVPTLCERCYNREWMRRKRAAQRQEEQTS